MWDICEDFCLSFITVGPFPYALINILKTWHLAQFGAKFLIFFLSNALVDDKNELAFTSRAVLRNPASKKDCFFQDSREKNVQDIGISKK